MRYSLRIGHEVLQGCPAEPRGRAVITEDPAAAARDAIAAVRGPAADHGAGTSHDADVRTRWRSRDASCVIRQDAYVRSREALGEQALDLGPPRGVACS